VSAADILAPTRDEQVSRLIDFYERLEPGSLPRLAAFYADRARFKDPFNDVCGVEPITKVFCHMFETLAAPRFIVTNRIVQGNQCFLTWNFEFRLRGSAQAALQTIRGGSHIEFDANGLVTSHRDYWDAAEELYEKLPVLGSLMRWLKKRASS
jgi:ketosteroid isomerase-like protein